MKEHLDNFKTLPVLFLILCCFQYTVVAQNSGNENNGGDVGFAPDEDTIEDVANLPSGAYSKEHWPGIETNRPITLSKGRLDIESGLYINLSKSIDGKSITITPNIYYGVSDKLSVGVVGELGVGSLFSIAPKLDGGLSFFQINEIVCEESVQKIFPSIRIRLLNKTKQKDKIFTSDSTLYALGKTKVFISNNLGKTWTTDTVGTLGGYPNDLTIDTAGYLYYANSKGLFKQHADTLVWKKISSFPENVARAVFADRKNRVYVSTYSKTYLSTDNGLTWIVDTVGAKGLAAQKFCDDRYGNIYAIAGNKIYRSMKGTEPWQQIDQPITSQFIDQNITKPFNAISADSVLAVATIFGTFISSDQGTTWSPFKSQITAGPIYGLIKTTSGKLFASTNLGIFSHTAGGGPWTKMYPQNGFVSGRPLYQDAFNNLYTLGERNDPSNLQGYWVVRKSIDGGATWSADSNGIGSLKKAYNYSFYVDESGTQHFMISDSVLPLYSKRIGEPWQPDTSGDVHKGNFVSTSWGSDKRGNIYVAVYSLKTYKGTLWKRPISGGTWITDTVGLNGEQLYSIAVDKNGNLFAGTYNGILKRANGIWSKISYPNGLSGNNAFVVSVDSSGALIAGFSSFVGNTAVWHGVYSTTNSGASWNYIGLDSLSVRQLISYGDTTYAITYGRGIFKFTKNKISFVENNNFIYPTQFLLEQNYPNPFNPTTTISYQLKTTGLTTLKIFDILGREITTLVHEINIPGKYSVKFDATTYASGIYFVRLQSGDKVQLKKMMLMK